MSSPSENRQRLRKGNRNFRHFEALIKAELCTVDSRRGDRARSNPMPHYDLAILVAGRRGLTSNQAFTHERAEDYAVSMGEMNDAKYHYHRAFKLYADWGACGIIEHLQESLGMIP